MTNKTPKTQTEAEARKLRLKAALKANMGRRKTQARARVGEKQSQAEQDKNG